MSVGELLMRLAPYGLVCRWMAARQGICIDKPLFYYPGLGKRLRRIAKFALPYGIVILYREHVFRHDVAGLVPSADAPASADEAGVAEAEPLACDRRALVLPTLPEAAGLEPQVVAHPVGTESGRTPDVTVVTVIFNIVKNGRAEHFRQCLDSVQAQQGVVIEHVIVDGASADGTLELLNGYRNGRHPMRVLSQPDKGIYDAMNKGLALAHGRYVTFLNSDDFYGDPKGLCEAVKRLEASNVEFSYAPTVMLDENGRPMEHPNVRPDVSRLSYAMVFCHQSVVMRTAAIRALGGFDTTYRSAADYDSVLRMVFAGYRAVRVDRPYVTFRAGGYSWVNMAESQTECGRVFSRLYGLCLGYRLTPEEGRVMCVTRRAPFPLADRMLAHVMAAFGFEGERARPRHYIGSDDRWNVVGLGDGEGWGAWGGKQLRIHVTIPDDLRGGDLNLSFYLGAFSDGKEVPTVTIRCNGRKLQAMTVRNFLPVRHDVTCPAAFVADGKAVFDIETSLAVRPAGETRTLGISFERLELAATSQEKGEAVPVPFWKRKDERIRLQTAEISAQGERIADLESRSVRMMAERDRLKAAVGERDAKIAALTAERDKLTAQVEKASNHCVCNVCGNRSDFRFGARILGKYDIRYYLCPSCGHVQTEKPYWLGEAYGSAISASDTGIVWRNQYMREVTLAVIARFFDPSAQVLEYAGGHGLLTRMLRDSGIDCRWHDKYAKPLFAVGFEDDGRRTYDLVTAFEALEHFTDPVAELKAIFARAGTLVFSEELLPEPVPAPADWWYYCLEHGQHVSLYSRKTLAYLAAHFGKRLVYHGSVGLLTDREIDEAAFAQCVEDCHAIAEGFKRPTLSVSDMNLMIERMEAKP